MTAPHPTDRRLAALVDGQLTTGEAAEVIAHASGCGRCLQRLGQCGGQNSVPDRSGLPAPAEAVLPPAASWEERDVEPAVGDIWRVGWEGVVELAVIRATDQESLRLSVLPVTEPEFSDQWCLITEVLAGSVRMPVAVSSAHEASIPWCVLDARVGSLPDTAIADLEMLRRSFRSGNEPTDELAVGTPVRSRLDERAEALDDLGDRFHELANADYVPAAQVEAAQAQALPTYDEMQQAGLPPRRILALGRGGEPTPEEVAAIESVTGRRLEATAPVVPVELRRQLDRPKWRPAVRGRAVRNSRTEPAERLAIVAEVTQPIAARGTGGQAVEWEVLLHQVLDD